MMNSTVTLPVLGESVEVWARLATPDAGNKRGTYFRPEPDDEVVLAPDTFAEIADLTDAPVPVEITWVAA